MAFCTECGTNVPDDVKFCTACGKPMGAAPKPEPVAVGAPTPAAAQPQAVPAYVPQPQQTPVPVSPPVAGNDAPPPKGSKYEPIGMGGYIGIMLLMCIPIVGQILTIVWACGGCRKVNKRNMARAMLVFLIISIVLGVIGYFVGRAVLGNVVNAIEDKTGISITDSAGSPTDDKSGLGGLLGIVGGLSGENGPTNRDIEALEDLGKVLDGLGGENSGLGDLIDGAQEANREAEAINDGWPKTLRAYPGGTATAVASYRTEISDTTLEEMMAWIEDLKGDGFAYQDFYEFGMSEEDMLGMNGWWAYDGNTYLSVSYSEGTVTVDHTKELPDLESYFK